MARNTKFTLDVDHVIPMLAKAQMKQSEKISFKGYTIFIADGFSEKPEVTYKRFGAEKDEFPNGAYCTLWFISRDDFKLDCGAPLLFDANHNREWDDAFREKARINTARKAAETFILTRGKQVSLIAGHA